MNVLLISANTLNSPYPVYPLGLDYVAGAISDRHNLRIIDMNAMDDIRKLDSEIKRFSPGLIGISLRNIDNTDTHDPRGFIGQYADLVRMVRSCSQTPIVLGGSGFTLFPRELMQALDADFGIVGEGERVGPLVDALENGRDITGLPGVVFNGSRPRFDGPFNGKFKRVVRPDYGHIPFYLKKGGMLNLQTRRGCRFNCIYCTYPHIEGHVLRNIDPVSVARTARNIEEVGAKYLFITDSAFNADYKHSMAVAREFIKAGISIPWGAFFAPTRPPDGYYRLMADAGLTHAEFGTESLSDPMLKSYKKPFRAGDVLQTHSDAISAGLHVAHYFLLGGPGETQATLNETLAQVDKLPESVLFFFCGMRIYPNTALYDMAVAAGQIRQGQDLLEPVFFDCGIDGDAIIRQVEDRAGGRMNWIIGAGGEHTGRILSRMHARGRIGPLWEHLIA